MTVSAAWPALLLLAGAAAAAPARQVPPTPLPHASFRLSYRPVVRAPSSYEKVASASNGAGTLYNVGFDEPRYKLGPAQVLELHGTPHDVGTAYGELVGQDAVDMYHDWIGNHFTPRTLETFDWLWRCALSREVPKEYLDELAGIDAGGEIVGVQNLAQMVTRVLTVATLPADSQNIQRVIAAEVAAHGNISSGSCLRSSARVVSHVRTPAFRAELDAGASRHGPGHCDFFAAWGSRTEGGRLLSSRNLDIHPDTGIARHKLFVVYRVDGRTPYTTIGYAGFFGALAGLSRDGITVSEANLDNGAVSFQGIAWPIRLRDLLAKASSLATARSMWRARNNTAAFNFLVGSASDAASGGPAAMALETIDGYQGIFTGNSEVEANATFSCVNGTVTDGRSCHWPDERGTVFRIGMPISEAVFRSNHAMDPRVMRTQEPLWNDTVMRYVLLHDRIVEATAVPGGMTAEAAINVTSLLGIKGADYGSCAPSNFKTGDPTHALSVVYDPSRGVAYSAWEDGHADTWRPAACNTYLNMSFSSWWKTGTPPATATIFDTK